MPTAPSSPATGSPTPDQKPYQPFGSAETLFYDRSAELVLEGPADTGKSMACLNKLHICAERVKNFRGLMLRKTRASLTESAMVTFEDKVLPTGHPAIRNRIERKNRHSYRYPNGGEIVCGGLDDPVKVYSTEYDMIYVQECRELTEDEWEQLGVRCSGRAGHMAYHQMMGDTNPDTPQHWLLLRAKRGQLKMLRSRHEDNPTFTPERRAALEALTGVRRARLLDGLWVAAEGMIYEDAWDRERNLVPARPIPPGWPRYISVDFGFTHPFVAQWWARDPDGRVVRYREIYMTGRLVEDHALTIRKYSKDEQILSVVCDHDAEDRATLVRHLRANDGVDRRAYMERTGSPMPPPILCSVTPAIKNVSAGLQAVAARMLPAGDGKPRLQLFQDVVVERDPSQLEGKRPSATEDEVEGYVWNDRVKREEPVKEHDDGMDAMRYLVATLDLGRNQKVLHMRTGDGRITEPKTIRERLMARRGQRRRGIRMVRAQ